MPRNGANIYTNPYDFVEDRDNGVPILAEHQQGSIDDIVADLNGITDGTIRRTGPIKHADGTATNPSVTFTGDENTGLFHPGADRVALAAGGSSVLEAGSSGIVAHQSITRGGTIIGDDAISMGVYRLTQGEDDHAFGLRSGSVAGNGHDLYTLSNEGAVTLSLNPTISGSNTAHSEFKVKLAGAGTAGDEITYDNELVARSDGVFTWRGDAVWTAGTDGAGSGLDADLFDGKQATEFAQLDANGKVPVSLLPDTHSTPSVDFAHRSQANTFTAPNTFQSTVNFGAPVDFAQGFDARGAVTRFGRNDTQYIEARTEENLNTLQFVHGNTEAHGVLRVGPLDAQGNPDPLLSTSYVFNAGIIPGIEISRAGTVYNVLTDHSNLAAARITGRIGAGNLPEDVDATTFGGATLAQVRDITLTTGDLPASRVADLPVPGDHSTTTLPTVLAALGDHTTTEHGTTTTWTAVPTPATRFDLTQEVGWNWNSPDEAGNIFDGNFTVSAAANARFYYADPNDQNNFAWPGQGRYFVGAGTITPTSGDVDLSMRIVAFDYRVPNGLDVSQNADLVKVDGRHALMSISPASANGLHVNIGNGGGAQSASRTYDVPLHPTQAVWAGETGETEIAAPSSVVVPEGVTQTQWTFTVLNNGVIGGRVVIPIAVTGADNPDLERLTVLLPGGGSFVARFSYVASTRTLTATAYNSANDQRYVFNNGALSVQINVASRVTDTWTLPTRYAQYAVNTGGHLGSTPDTVAAGHVNRVMMMFRNRYENDQSDDPEQSMYLVVNGQLFQGTDGLAINLGIPKSHLTGDNLVIGNTAVYTANGQILEYDGAAPSAQDIRSLYAQIPNWYGAFYPPGHSVDKFTLDANVAVSAGHKFLDGNDIGIGDQLVVMDLDDTPVPPLTAVTLPENYRDYKHVLIYVKDGPRESDSRVLTETRMVCTNTIAENTPRVRIGQGRYLSCNATNRSITLIGGNFDTTGDAITYVKLMN